MGRIQVLADSTINRIAAGEVVDRPASVLKELVENSLDSAARAIEVVLEGGGKRRIRVDDDGCGMDRDDALLAVERHATSKLGRAAELETIATLGFRGEALSSIAAVSRLTLRTAETSGPGTEVEVHGGRIRAVREIGLPAGTSVQVDRLFFNTPARRRFLRSESTELAHALRWLTRYALVHPDKSFRLQHGGRRLVDAPAVGDERQRIAQVCGARLTEKLLPFAREVEGIRIHGFAGRPVDGLPRRDAQHFFVNGRAVQDRVLGHAVSQAYSNTMPHGRHPALFLFIEVEPLAVDVNVHPQKTEVRFRDASRVHDGVRDALQSALAQGGAVPRLSELRPVSWSDERASVRRATLRYLETHEGDPAPGAPGGPGRDETAAAVRPAAAPPRENQAPLLAVREPREAAPPPELQPLAQFNDSYIIAQDRQGLVLVDQHAAHERVLFEKYLAEAEENQVEMQRLMFPLTLELSVDERVVFEQELEEFRRLGFLVEPFGGDAVRLDGVPSVAGEADAERLFRELLGEASQARSATAGVEALRRRLVTTTACHAAIKVNHPLTAESMRGLLADLHETRNPTTCPHGRPSLFRLTLDEIERAFRRR